MKPKDRNLAVLLLSVVVIAGLGLAYLTGLNLGTITATQVYRPVWGSLGCETTGDTPNAKKYFSYAGKIDFVCEDTECKLTAPTSGKRGCDIGLGILDDYWEIGVSINNGYETGCRTYNGILDISSNCLSITAKQGDVINVRGKCLVGTPYVSGENFATFNYHEIILKKYVDGSPFDVSGGKHCYVSSAKQELSAKQPYNPSKTELWKTLIPKTILGITINPYNLNAGSGEGTTKINSLGYEYLSLGRYIPFLVEWKLIDPLNTNRYQPKAGKFSGKDILCDTALNKVYLLEPVSTPSGTYTIPTTDLGAVVCCNEADCYGANEVCDTADTFTCKSSTQRSCYSDLQCGDNVGRDSSGKPYVNDGSCVNGFCQWAKKSVECIKSSDCPYRANYYAECTREYTCLYTPQNIKQNCPYGSCCSGEGNYYAKSCSSGQSCCWVNNQIGECKVGECASQCQTNTECNDGNANTKDYCQYGKCVNEVIPYEQTCEEKSQRSFLGLFNYPDPIAYLSCVIDEFVQGVVKLTLTTLKLVMVSALAVIVASLANKNLGKKAKKKDRNLYLILSVLLGLLTGYVAWVLVVI